MIYVPWCYVPFMSHGVWSCKITFAPQTLIFGYKLCFFFDSLSCSPLEEELHNTRIHLKLQIHGPFPKTIVTSSLQQSLSGGNNEDTVS